MKKTVYWCGLLVLLGVGMLVSFHQMLPICNPVPFLLGLLFVWIGLMALLKINDYWTRDDARSVEVASSVVFMGFGAAYVALSFTQKATEGLPILLVSVPFIIAMAGVEVYAHWRR